MGVAGCDDARSSSPTASSPVQPPPTPQPTPGDAVADVTLSGVVFEMTPAGRVPVAGARVFLSDDQDMLTDASGFFSYTPVWVCPCRHHSWLAAGNTIIWAGKDGYDDMPGQPQLP